jgi:hypothetical protein
MEEKEIAAIMERLNTEPDNYIAHFRNLNKFFIETKPMINPEFIKSLLFVMFKFPSQFNPTFFVKTVKINREKTRRKD